MKWFDLFLKWYCYGIGMFKNYYYENCFFSMYWWSYRLSSNGWDIKGYVGKELGYFVLDVIDNPGGYEY